jgi:hypothetical protein
VGVYVCMYVSMCGWVGGCGCVGVQETITSLERRLAVGDISQDEFESAKALLSKQFFDSVVGEGQLKRAFISRDIQIQVTNSAQFTDSWQKFSKVRYSGFVGYIYLGTDI